MQAQIGQIYDGVVTGLTNFGAFVKLPTGESGMVHISEVSTAYVADIHEYLSEGQQVKVKVLGVNENNKIGLSIKQAAPPAPPAAERTERPRPKRPQSRPQTWQGPKAMPAADGLSFEDMMSRFKAESDEKISGLKKSEGSSRNNGYSRRAGKK